MPNISPWDACQDGNPIGGGTGYDRIVTSGTHYVRVSGASGSNEINYTTANALANFIEARSNGDVVFLDPNLNMDVSSLGDRPIDVPAGVTVASDRGNGISEGAFLYSNTVKYNQNGQSERPIFRAAGHGMRITGFTARGPFGESGNYDPTPAAYLQRLKTFISSNWDNTEVDNMHIYNWPSAGVTYGRHSSPPGFFGREVTSFNNNVHHSYIHNRKQNGHGYGVDCRFSVMVRYYANISHSHRRDLNSTGQQESGFESFCNTILSGGTHGNMENHATGRSDCGIPGENDYCVEPIFGNPKVPYSYIHHNAFLDDGSGRHGQTHDMQNLSLNGFSWTDPQRVEYNITVRTKPFWNSQAPWTYFIRRLFVQDQWQDDYITLVGNIYNWDGISQIPGEDIANGGSPPPFSGITNMAFTGSRNNNNQMFFDENTVNPTAQMYPITQETGETYSYAKTGTRPDDGLFSISGDQLTLNLTPDYENPQDNEPPGGNNVYGVNVIVTSTSGATFEQDMAFWIENVPTEGDVYVTDISFNNKNQTIYVGDSLDLSHTFTPPNPKFPGVTFSEKDFSDIILDSTGRSIGVGSTEFFIKSEDITNGDIFDVMTVTVLPIVNNLVVEQILDNGFRIDLTTLNQTDTKIVYGTTSGIYTNTLPFTNKLKSSHERVVGSNNKLEPNTTYYWAIITKDENDNTGLDTEYTTTTSGPLLRNNNNKPIGFGASPIKKAYVGNNIVIK